VCGLRPDPGARPESIPGWWLGPGRIRPQGWAEGASFPEPRASEFARNPGSTLRRPRTFAPEATRVRGLDHLEFLVAYTANAMLTFRDPDNIQLEFFWRATAPEGV
jgi:hypothetical protein